MVMDQMTVCQTCGHEGYSDLLIHCVRCQIVAVHRYCVDGPPLIDDEKITWCCEECVPRVVKHTPPSRKCERTTTPINIQELCQRARKKWTKDVNHPVVESTYLRENVEASSGMSALKPQCDGGKIDSQQVWSKGKTNPKLPQVSDDSKVKATGIYKTEEDDHSLPLRDQKRTPPSKIMQASSKEVWQGSDNSGTQTEVTAAKDNGFSPASLNRQKKSSLSTNNSDKMNSQVLTVLEKRKIENSSFCTVDGVNRLVKVRKDASPQHSEVLDGPPEADQGKEECISVKGQKLEDCIRKAYLDQDEEPDNTRISQAGKQPESAAADKETQEAVEATADSFGESRGENKHSSTVSDHRGPGKKKRRMVIEMEYSDREPDSVVAEHCQIVANVGKDLLRLSGSGKSGSLDKNMACSQRPPRSNDCISTEPSPVKLSDLSMSVLSPVGCVSAQPVTNAVWRGCCTISNNVHPMSFGLEAHLSSKAHARVHGASSALPSTIDFEIVPKRFGWPKIFEESPPTGDIIGLYFFPASERDESCYTNTLDRMINSGLMLMSDINNLELLVFSSRELPEGEWRYQRNYYLWGVFRQKEETFESSKLSALQLNAGSIRPSNNRQLDLTDTTKNVGSPSSSSRNIIKPLKSEDHCVTPNSCPEASQPKVLEQRRPLPRESSFLRQSSRLRQSGTRKYDDRVNEKHDRSFRGFSRDMANDENGSGQKKANSSKSWEAQNWRSDLALRKLYLWPLAPKTTSEMIIDYFARYGQIEDVQVAHVKANGDPRLYAFITYETVEAATKALDSRPEILGDPDRDRLFGPGKKSIIVIKYARAPR